MLLQGELRGLRMEKNYLHLATFMQILFEIRLKSLTIYPGAHEHFPVTLSQSAPLWQGQVSWQPSPYDPGGQDSLQ